MKRNITIAITNQKGGVGKTTTTLSLAAGLSRKGKNVLVIDLDPQGQCATALGLDPAPGVFYLLTMGQAPHEQSFIRQLIRDTGREGLSLLPGNPATMTAQTIVNAENRPISCVREAIAPFSQERFRYILLDTAPSVGGIQERAIWASDMVIIPTSTEYLSTDSVKKITDTMLYLQQEKAWKGKLLGVLPTFFHGQLREHRAAMEDLRRGFGDLVLPPIHRSALLGECPGESKTVFEKDPRSRATREYEKLVDLVLEFS